MLTRPPCYYHAPATSSCNRHPPNHLERSTASRGRFVNNPRREGVALQLYLKRKDRPKSSYQALGTATQTIVYPDHFADVRI